MTNISLLKSKFSNLGRDKYLFLFAILFALFFMVVVAASFFLPSQRKEVTQVIPTPTSTSSEVTVKTYPTIVFEAAPDSIKAGVGEFTGGGHLESEADKEQLPDGSVKYTFASADPKRSDILIVKDEQVMLRRHAVVGVGQDLSHEYKDLLGKQDYTLDVSTFYGPNTAIYFYAELGTALIVDPKTEKTYEVFTFPPLSIEEFVSKYRKYAL